MTEEAFQKFLDDVDRMLEYVAQTWCGEWEVVRTNARGTVELRSHNRRRRYTVRTIYQITSDEAGKATPEDLVRAVTHDHAEMIVAEGHKVLNAASGNGKKGAVGRLAELGRSIILG